MCSPLSKEQKIISSQKTQLLQLSFGKTSIIICNHLKDIIQQTLIRLNHSFEIKTHTVNNVTTDANGGFDSGLYVASAIIVGVNATVGTGFITVGGTYNGQWIMQVRNFSNGTLKTNSNIGNIEILYHDR